jgi:predicted DNA-binding ribbon-helix-helix protein
MIRKDRTASRIVKHSINVGGHQTSVSLEDGFWGALREIAVTQNLRMSELVSRIDKDRQKKQPFIGNPGIRAGSLSAGRV